MYLVKSLRGKMLSPNALKLRVDDGRNVAKPKMTSFMARFHKRLVTSDGGHH